MSLTREDVIQIAQLARLSLTEEEIRSFQEQLSAILDHADRLKEVDTKGISPTASVLSTSSSLRDDSPKSGLSLKAALQNSSRNEADQFRVPPVLDEA
jgi:aspartyl-tRNA(Asn)/glutamyl-tRNA(Gln) amidotransferase subunit C